MDSTKKLQQEALTAMWRELMAITVIFALAMAMGTATATSANSKTASANKTASATDSETLTRASATEQTTVTGTKVGVTAPSKTTKNPNGTVIQTASASDLHGATKTDIATAIPKN
jgi:hypothetical protein